MGYVKGRRENKLTHVPGSTWECLAFLTWAGRPELPAGHEEKLFSLRVFKEWGRGQERYWDLHPWTRNEAA